MSTLNDTRGRDRTGLEPTGHQERLREQRHAIVHTLRDQHRVGLAIEEAHESNQIEKERLGARRRELHEREHSLARRGEALDKMEREFEEETRRVCHTGQWTRDGLYTLDVGGVLYITSVSTLRSKPGTLLAAMFSGRYELPMDSNGHVFIDRSGDLFAYVLEYTRGGVVSVDVQDKYRLLWRLKREFEFFAIELYTTREVGVIVVESDRLPVDVRRFMTYDAVTGKTIPIVSPDVPRVLFEMCTVNRCVFIIGGKSRHNGGAVDVVDCYTPHTGKWARLAPMPDTRFRHAVCVLNGSIYVMGGKSISATGITELSTSFRYDPQTDVWVKLRDIPMALYGCHACVIGDKIYLVGGTTCVQSEPNLVVYVYDIQGDDWSVIQLNDTDLAAITSAVCISGEDLLYLLGGCPAITGHSHSVVVYDITNSSWADAAPIPTILENCKLLVLNGVMYATGDEPVLGDATDYLAVFRYDEKDDTWTKLDHDIGCGMSIVTTCVTTQDTNWFESKIDEKKAMDANEDM